MKKLLNFIKDAKAELKKVEWPQKDDVVNSTIVVLISIVVISIGLGIMDAVMSSLLKFFMGAS